MNKILVDTSIIIDYLRQKERINTHYMKLVQQNYELYISIITHTELFSGKRVWENKKLYNYLEILCSELHIIPLKEPLSQKSGKIKAIYNLTTADAIIAATAIQEDISLVTLNIKDFHKIKELSLFQENN